MNNKKRYQDLKSGKDYIDLGQIHPSKLDAAEIFGIQFDRNGHLYNGSGAVRTDGEGVLEELNKILFLHPLVKDKIVYNADLSDLSKSYK